VYADSLGFLWAGILNDSGVVDDASKPVTDNVSSYSKAFLRCLSSNGSGAVEVDEFAVFPMLYSQVSEIRSTLLHIV